MALPPACLPLVLGAALAGPAATQELASFDGHLKAVLTVAEDVRYSLLLDDRRLVSPSEVFLELGDGRVLGRGARLLRVDRRELDEAIPTPIGKRATVRNAFRELALVLSDGATLRARLFDDGFALRWETALAGRVRVRHEGFTVAFPEEPQAFMLTGEGAHHGYEGLWKHEPISTLGWSTA
ncbi:MAG TPA: glycoside hydrolase family 97 N-terminal domain-containing protein, partial [Vicinamibacteria bacterium]|nr:glycoside hydrolase family 97 N-terminal domain-containing protein [Vicinamibacteria bacterium]